MQNQDIHFNKALEEYEKEHFTNAIFHFKKSSSDYSNQSMHYLGIMYELGLGTKDQLPNAEKAFRYYYKAYNSGNNQAGNCFLRIYDNFKDKLEYLLHKYPDMHIQQTYSSIMDQKQA